MPTLELLTYTLANTGNTQGLNSSVLGTLNPDLIALQGVDAKELERETSTWPVHTLIGGKRNDKAIISRHKISGMRTFDLGDGADCIAIDLTFLGKRIHLINLQLSEQPTIRFQQLRTLVSADIINNRRFPGTLLIVGDFAGPLFHPSNLLLTLYMKQGFRSTLRGNYPAQFPVIHRNRLYAIGDVQPVSTTIINNPEAKAA